MHPSIHPSVRPSVSVDGERPLHLILEAKAVAVHRVHLAASVSVHATTEMDDIPPRKKELTTRNKRTRRY